MYDNLAENTIKEIEALADKANVDGDALAQWINHHHEGQVDEAGMLYTTNQSFIDSFKECYKGLYETNNEFAYKHICKEGYTGLKLVRYIDEKAYWEQELSCKFFSTLATGDTGPMGQGAPGNRGVHIFSY